MLVLVADDEAVIRMGLRVMLEEGGHHVVAATNGQSAVELARSQKPELVILDIKMPELDGLEAARQIMQHQPAPIVMLTAYSQRELIEQARAASVFAYLVKPVKEELLAPTLELAFARFQEWKKLRREVQDLQASLEARELVEAAKRALMAREHLTERQAFLRIHQRSRARRVPMQKIAQEILRHDARRAG